MMALVNGGAGYIGSHTAVALMNAGHEAVTGNGAKKKLPEEQNVMIRHQCEG